MQMEAMAPAKKTVKFEADPLISFIVPVHAKHLDRAVLKRCLMSLDDQDYENLEVVIVLNGGDDKALEDTAMFYVNKDKRFRLIKTPEGGELRVRPLQRRHRLVFQFGLPSETRHGAALGRYLGPKP
jgi:cellulose synthase/poly-beta-1,6-N-acetylglucosamine synthase-like glycosyltransferase